MNAPIKINKIEVTEIDTPTPKSLTITPRDRRFGRDPAQMQRRWWHGGDPVATAFYNTLSVSFPKGEAFFIESVKAHRDGSPSKLAEEIRVFTMQEVAHSREHLAFNRRVIDSGYDATKQNKRVDALLERSRSRPSINNLAITIAMEHFTAIMAHELLQSSQHMAGAEAEVAGLWRWHAIEEIEHKAVAYDTWLHATRDWTRFKRWRLKALSMLMATIGFIPIRIKGTVELLQQDDYSRFDAWRKTLWYVFGYPGCFRKIAWPWFVFFLPGFHPWNLDDRYLLEKAVEDATEQSQTS